MATVTFSRTYHVLIPSEVRERLKFKPGQKMAVVEKDGVVHLIPVRPLKQLKGMVAWMSMKGIRDEGDQG
jgi:AbrB family looped-hinge helix DNA binding protein